MHDEFEWEVRTLDARAVIKLVELHFDEYQALRRDAQEERIDTLERRVHEQQKLIDRMKRQNPDGLYAPALAETVNRLLQDRGMSQKQAERLVRDTLGAK